MRPPLCRPWSRCRRRSGGTRPASCRARTGAHRPRREPGGSRQARAVPAVAGRRSGAPANSRIPSAKATSAVNPSTSRARVGSANTCRTSPSRKPPVTRGTGSPGRRSASAMSRMVRGEPVHTLNAPGGGLVAGQGEHVRPGDVGHVHEVAQLAAVLEHRRCLAAPVGAAEQARNAGVRRVLRHPGAVHVVVPERRGGAAGVLPGVRGARGPPGPASSSRTRCEDRPSAPPAPGQPRAATRTSGTPARSGQPSRSVRRRGGGRTTPCVATPVSALAVHHRARREHEAPAEPALVQRAQERRRRAVVASTRTRRRRRSPRPGRPWQPGGRPRRPRRAPGRTGRCRAGRPRRTRLRPASSSGGPSCTDVSRSSTTTTS